MSGVFLIFWFGNKACFEGAIPDLTCREADLPGIGGSTRRSNDHDFSSSLKVASSAAAYRLLSFSIFLWGLAFGSHGILDTPSRRWPPGASSMLRERRWQHLTCQCPSICARTGSSIFDSVPKQPPTCIRIIFLYNESIRQGGRRLPPLPWYTLGGIQHTIFLTRHLITLSSSTAAEQLPH
jgi:hypothetical protein